MCYSAVLHSSSWSALGGQSEVTTLLLVVLNGGGGTGTTPPGHLADVCLSAKGRAQDNRQTDKQMDGRLQLLVIVKWSLTA